MSKNESIFNEAIDLGVKGYVLKDDLASDILKCLEAVAAGQVFVSATISGLLLRRRNRARDLAKEKPSIEDLTPMQRRVLKLIAQNKTTKEIAVELFISPFTVETHRCNICTRLNLGGFQPVLRFALEHRSAL
jgi:DNA-binding NarL/FixJ family response regulator